MEIVTCPSTSQIVQLLFGELSGPIATQLTAHVQNCSRCIESMDTLEKLYLNPGATSPVPSLPSQAIQSRSNKFAFLDAPIQSDEIGRLAHYRVLRLLGEGGMGMVLQAEDTNLERAVALKVIKTEFLHDNAVRQRFLREARAMAQVKSDHVVTVHQVAQHNDICYIAMELLEGAPLSVLLEGDNVPPLSETLRIGREIAQALTAAHSCGLIHRDIKPDNVWLEAPAGRVKVLDFGLARPQQEQQGNIKLTVTGMIMGSPLYMSPEQARGVEIDERTDLFSLGALLYALITGQPPFARTTAMDTMLALVNETAPPPSYWNPDCPPELEKLVMDLLVKDPDDRLKSAQLLIARLEMIEAKVLPGRENSPTIELSPSKWSRGAAATPAQPVNSIGASELRRSNFNKSERRQLTVLVCGCELFESEEYLESLDVENQESMLRSFENSCKQVVTRFNGTVVQCNEEGLIACFGYPIAHEDAAQLASLSALAILEALAPLSDKLTEDNNLHLGPWIVVHTGSAIAATKGLAVSLVGEARNVAIRLKEFARAGQIVLSESTHSILRGKFNCQSLGQKKIKGVERPIELFKLQSPIEESDADESSIPIELTPLTGRNLEMSLLKNRWEQAQEGQGQVVLLTGEAGFGKSRLVHAVKELVGTQLANETNEHDSPFVEWRGSPHFQNTGLYPASEFFSRLLHFRRDEPADVQFDRLVNHLERYGLATKEVIPLFASLLSLPQDDRFPSLILTPAREREEMFRALEDWLQAYSAEQTVLFVIEDLHWLDASTLEFLGRFVANGMHDRILTLLTFRPEFRTPWPALEHQTSLSLSRLSRPQVAELMKKQTASNVPEALIDQIYDRSGGVPLFVEEFTKMVKDSGFLTQDIDSNQLKSMMARAIPSTLNDLIMARLDRMEGNRELAQLASAIGRDFSYDLLAAVAGADEVSILETELSKLVKAEILLQKGRPPRSTYSFKHALLQDGLYNAMVKTHRHQCHALIAEAMEVAPQSVQTKPEVIAHHLTEAGLTEKSISYWLAAGLKSQEQFANVEAISHFKKGLELVGTLSESLKCDRHELSLLSPLGSAYQATMGYAAPEVGPAFSRARELCQKLGDSTQLFEIMWGNWTWQMVRGDLELSIQLADEMLVFAQDAQDKGMTMEAYVALAVTNFFRGDFAKCRTLCEKAIADFEDLEKCLFWSSKLGQNSAVVLRCYLCLSLWHLGFPDQALEMSNEVLALARQVAHPFSLAHTLYYTSWLYLHCRMENELNSAALEVLAIAKDQGFALWQATGTFHLGSAMLLQDDLEGALNNLESGIKSFMALAAAVSVPGQLAVLCEGYVLTGRFEEAQQALDDGLARAEITYDRSYWAELCRLKGTLILATSDQSSAAEIHFKEAIDTARTQNSKAWELRATISLARLWQQQGQIKQARDILSTIYSAFTEGMKSHDLREAKELLASLN